MPSTPSEALGDGDGTAHPPGLDVMLNLAHFHREHEKFYASAPRERSVLLQRHARVLHALADRWSTAPPSTTSAPSPFAGAEDLNDPVAMQLDGVLFMEGGNRPAELDLLLRDLRATAEDYAGTGEWLAGAMHASWELAAALTGMPGFEDLLGDRHRIIVNDWLAADMSALVAKLLLRAADVLDELDWTPRALRSDLAGARRSPALLHSAAELVNHAADLCSDSAGLVNDNERRWRLFRERAVAAAAPDGRAARPAPPHS